MHYAAVTNPLADTGSVDGVQTWAGTETPPQQRRQLLRHAGIRKRAKNVLLGLWPRRRQRNKKVDCSIRYVWPMVNNKHLQRCTTLRAPMSMGWLYGSSRTRPMQRTSRLRSIRRKISRRLTMMRPVALPWPGSRR